MGFGVWGMWFVVWVWVRFLFWGLVLVFGFWGLGCGVWGVGCGIWGSGFGVLGLGVGGGGVGYVDVIWSRKWLWRCATAVRNLVRGVGVEGPCQGVAAGKFVQKRI